MVGLMILVLGRTSVELLCDDDEDVEDVDADRVGAMIRMPGRVFLITTSSESEVEARTLRGCKGDDE